MTTRSLPAREERILDAAERILVRQGVSGLTLRAVAAEAGTPLGTLHYSFRSKEDLMLRLVDRTTRATSALIAVRSGGGATLAEVLREGISAFWASVLAQETGYHIMQYELALRSARHRTEHRIVRAQFLQYTEVIEAALWRFAHPGTDEGVVRRVARLILATMDGLILQYVAVPDRERTLHDVAAATDMLVLLANSQLIPSRS